MWLNPLQLLLALGVWWRSWRRIAGGVAIYDIVAIPILLMAWHAQPQSGSAAIFIFMASAPLLGVLYAIKSAKSSYNINMAVTSGKHKPTKKKSSGRGRVKKK